MQALQNGFHDLQGCRKLKYVVSSAQWHEDTVIPNVPEVYTISSTCSLSQEENLSSMWHCNDESASMSQSAHTEIVPVV